jgi:hypothetical protein
MVISKVFSGGRGAVRPRLSRVIVVGKATRRGRLAGES